MLWPAKPDKESSYWGALRWCLTSDEQLLNTEAHLLSGVKSIEEGVFVDIGPVIDSAGDRVLTYIANKAARDSATPLLLVHGFAGGAGLWSQNIDALAKDRTVYAIDVVGFGRSSRPTFSSNPMEAEDQFISTIEAWRKVVGLEKMFLLGHSFGGYLSTLYAMKYPDRVEHLVLVDPWGFPERPPSYKLPVWALPIEFGAACVLPLFALRAAGPLGYLYLRLMPPFNTHNFRSVSNAKRTTTDYFYHLNVKKPSGEVAFHKLMEGIAWARFPMLPRMHGLCKEVPITFIYGEKSWVWRSSGFKIQEMRKDSYVDVDVVAAAGHVVSSDQPQVFNAVVSRVLRSVDMGKTPGNVLTTRAPVVGQDLTGTTVLRPANTEEEETSMSPASTEQGVTSTEQPSSSTELGQSSSAQGYPCINYKCLGAECGMSSADDVWLSADEGQPSTDLEPQRINHEVSTTLQDFLSTDKVFSNADQVFSNTDQVFSNTDQVFSNTDQVFSNADQVFSNADQVFSNADQVFSNTDQVFSNADQILTNTYENSGSENQEDSLSEGEDSNNLRTQGKDYLEAQFLGTQNGMAHLTIDDDCLQRPDIKSDLFVRPSVTLDNKFSHTSRATIFSDNPSTSELADTNYISSQRVAPKRKKGKLPRNKNSFRSGSFANCKELIN